jgi:hypothetical protein
MELKLLTQERLIPHGTLLRSDHDGVVLADGRHIVAWGLDDGVNMFADIGWDVGMVELMKADNLSRGIINCLVYGNGMLRVGDVLAQSGGESGKAVFGPDASKTDFHQFIQREQCRINFDRHRYFLPSSSR